jgi:hypothetical protein
MRAKRVYESVSFQRGRDPKEALGLGLLRSLEVQALADGWLDPNMDWGFDLGLLYAIDRGKGPKIIEGLLDAGADPNGGPRRKGRPLLIAVTIPGGEKVVDLLLRRGADPYGDGGDVIMTAASIGDVDLMKTLLSGIRKTVKARAIKKGFYHAVRKNRLPMARLLAREGRIGIDTIDKSLSSVDREIKAFPNYKEALLPMREFLESLL